MSAQIQGEFMGLAVNFTLTHDGVFIGSQHSYKLEAEIVSRTPIDIDRFVANTLRVIVVPSFVDRQPMAQSVTSRCTCCGYEWKTGQSVAHDCTTILKGEVKMLRAANEAAVRQEQMVRAEANRLRIELTDVRKEPQP